MLNEHVAAVRQWLDELLQDPGEHWQFYASDDIEPLVFLEVGVVCGVWFVAIVCDVLWPICR